VLIDGYILEGEEWSFSNLRKMAARK